MSGIDPCTGAAGKNQYHLLTSYFPAFQQDKTQNVNAYYSDIHLHSDLLHFGIFSGVLC